MTGSRGAVRAAALMMLAASATACALTVDGTPVAAPGPSVATVLPTDAELSALLGYQVHTDAAAPKVGGVDQLRDLLIRDPSQIENFDCLGVVEPVMQQIYSGAPVQSATFADEDDLTYGAVALTSPAAAGALFAKFSEQWKQCRGKTVITHQRGSIFAQQITDVDVTDSMLTATVLASSPVTPNPPNSWQRALGLAGDVIVDVNAPHDLGSADPATGNPAVRIANVMLAKAARG